MSELACHLEEKFGALRQAGIPEDQALAIVAAEGNKLGRTVRRLGWQAEGGMRALIRAVLLPGIILAVFYEVCVAALGVYWEYPSSWREAWLVPICLGLGFCASSISRELGGKATQPLWAAALVVSVHAMGIGIMVFLYTPLQFLQQAETQAAGTTRRLAVNLLWILLWDVVIPGGTLILGALVSAWTFRANNAAESTFARSL